MMFNEPPKTVFLQYHGDGDSEDMSPVDADGISWCWDRIFPQDIEYVLKSEYEVLKAERDALKARIDGGQRVLVMKDSFQTHVLLMSSASNATLIVDEEVKL